MAVGFRYGIRSYGGGVAAMGRWGREDGWWRGRRVNHLILQAAAGGVTDWGGGLAHDCPRRQGQKDWQNREENSLWIDWACGGGLGIASSTVSAAMRELWLRRTFGFSEAFAGLRAAFPRLGRYRYRCYSIGETTEIIPRYQS